MSKVISRRRYYIIIRKISDQSKQAKQFWKSESLPLTFMTAMLKACRISSGVDNRTPSSLLDFRRRWAAVKAPESLSVSVSFSDAWKYDSTLKPLWCTIPSESLLVDCMFISVRFVFISTGMFAVATCMNKRDLLPCKINLPSTTYAARKLVINIGIALSKIPLAKMY